MKRILALLLFALPAIGQVNNPQIRPVQTDPSGTTPCTLPWQYNSADGTAWYPANQSAGSCTWAQFAGGAGTPTTGTGTANYYALWTGTSTLGNGHIDDGVTTAATITASEPFTAQGTLAGLGLNISNGGNLNMNMTSGTNGFTNRDIAFQFTSYLTQYWAWGMSGGHAFNVQDTSNSSANRLYLPAGGYSEINAIGANAVYFNSDQDGSTTAGTGGECFGAGGTSTNCVATIDGAGNGTFLTLNTNTKCAAVGTSASPSVVSCSAAAAGHFSCATNASAATCTINTTAATVNSTILVDSVGATSIGTLLGVTCNTAPSAEPTIKLTAQSAGSFSINPGTFITNPACFEYAIIN